MSPFRPLSFDRLAAALAFLAIFTTACLMPAQSDTWWHLREGEVLWAGGAALTDHFSYTAAGGYWQDRESLSEVLFFLLYRAGGLPLLTLFLASLVAYAWTLVWQLLEGPVLTRVLLMGIGVAASGMQWSVRPQLFSFAFLSTTAFLLAKDLLWPLPLLFLLWANIHAGVIVGLASLVVRRVGQDGRSRKGVSSRPCSLRSPWRSPFSSCTRVHGGRSRRLEG